jgi:hypothetical protein
MYRLFWEEKKRKEMNVENGNMEKLGKNRIAIVSELLMGRVR